MVKTCYNFEGDYTKLYMRIVKCTKKKTQKRIQNMDSDLSFFCE